MAFRPWGTKSESSRPATTESVPQPGDTLNLSFQEWTFDGDDGHVEGRGYSVLQPDGTPTFDLDRVNQQLAPFEGFVTDVAGVRQFPFAEDECFDPGQPVVLVPEPENEYDLNTVGVWDAKGTKQLGHLPRAVAATISKELATTNRRHAMSSWEWRQNGQRVGVRIIIAPGLQPVS